MRNLSDELRAIAEAAIRAGIPNVQFVSPQLVIGGLQELETEVTRLGALREQDTYRLHNVSSRNIELTAEVERLRDALQEIAESSHLGNQWAQRKAEATLESSSDALQPPKEISDG